MLDVRAHPAAGFYTGLAALANPLAFSSHLGVFKPITRSHRNTDPSTRKAEAGMEGDK